MECYIVKLGGSVITIKGEKGRKVFPTNLEEIMKKGINFYRGSVVSRLVNEIYDAHQRKVLNLSAFFNGAGPFGHDLAKLEVWKKHRSAELVHESVKYLHSLVKNTFTEKGYMFEDIPPFETCYYSGTEQVSEITEIGKFDYTLWWNKAKEKKPENIISSYGDIVPVTEGVKGRFDGYDIISGDDLYLEFGSRMKPDKAIFVFDEDGVFAEDPKKNPEAELIPIITSKDSIDKYFPRVSTDATGGFKKKIKKAQVLASRGVSSQFINGLVPGRLYDALCGNETTCTFVIP